MQYSMRVTGCPFCETNGFYCAYIEHIPCVQSFPLHVLIEELKDSKKIEQQD